MSLSAVTSVSRANDPNSEISRTLSSRNRGSFARIVARMSSRVMLRYGTSGIDHSRLPRRHDSRPGPPSSTPSKKPNGLADHTNRILKLTKGTATGPLIGGNLTMIASLMGTPYQPDPTNAILFLEDVHEEPYRIDRMLTTLSLGGMFDKVSGILFGHCSDCGVKGPSFSLEEILRDRFGSLPVLSGLSFGHIEQKLVLPIGARATLDADAGVVRVEEGVVG